VTTAISSRERWPFHTGLGSIAAIACRPLHALLSVPWLLFLITLGFMMFRTPQVQLFGVDRILFVLLVLVALARASLDRRLPSVQRLTWPLFGLLLLGIPAVLTDLSDPQGWSLFIAKWGAPFAMFHLAPLVFDDAQKRHWLEIFLSLALAYLVIVSIATFAGIKQLVVPQYILDDNLGIQAGRARGPFLQSVANGLSLNLLGLLALDSFRRGRLRGVFAFALLTALPVAILATLTRSVWLSFSASVVILTLISASRRLRGICAVIILLGVAGLSFAALRGSLGTAVEGRLEDRATLEYRVEMYRAGSQMFQERPFLGWGAIRTPYELAKRIDGFRQDCFYFHNTYLEILVQYGLFGFGLYAWLIVELLRLRKRRIPRWSDFPDAEFTRLWPVLLGVYMVNGFFVVLNYQFVNALLFTLAGLLAAPNRPDPVLSSEISSTSPLSLANR
jgi:putative inorganic carbon (hco3(-)) transporter